MKTQLRAALRDIEAIALRGERDHSYSQPASGFFRDIVTVAREARAALGDTQEPRPLGVGDGTTTDCPQTGVHNHPFRGPHRFTEWYPVAAASPAAPIDPEHGSIGWHQREQRHFVGDATPASDPQLDYMGEPYPSAAHYERDRPNVEPPRGPDTTTTEATYPWTSRRAAASPAAGSREGLRADGPCVCGRETFTSACMDVPTPGDFRRGHGYALGDTRANEGHPH